VQQLHSRLHCLPSGGDTTRAGPVPAVRAAGSAAAQSACCSSCGNADIRGRGARCTGPDHVHARRASTRIYADVWRGAHQGRRTAGGPTPVYADVWRHPNQNCRPAACYSPVEGRRPASARASNQGRRSRATQALAPGDATNDKGTGEWPIGGADNCRFGRQFSGKACCCSRTRSGDGDLWETSRAVRPRGSHRSCIPAGPAGARNTG
jgi:hypothetical protein